MRLKIIVCHIFVCFFCCLPIFSAETTVLKGGIEWASVRDNEYEEVLNKEKVLILDLETVLQMALDQNLDINVQEFSVKKTKDQLLNSATQFLPSVSFGQILSRKKGAIQIFGSRALEIDIKSVQPQIQTTFGLFQGGRVLFGWLSNKKLLASEKKNFDSVKQSIIQQAAITYYALQRYKAELESEMARLDQANLNLKERKIAKELGADIGLSVLLAQQELDQSVARIEEIKGNLYIESGKLNEILNIPQNILIIPSEGLNEKSLITWQNKPQINNLIAQAQAYNPAIEAVKFLEESAKAKKLQTISGFLPTIQLSSANAWVGPKFGELSPINQYMLYAQYDILKNLGGEAVSDYLLAKHSQQEVQSKLQRDLKKLENEVTKNYLELNAGERVFWANKSSLKYSEEAYKQALARLKAEVGVPYEVKVAQTELEKARANYFYSLIKYKIAQVNLIKTLGLASPNSLVKGIEL